MNAIHEGSADAEAALWKITQGMLEREIEEARGEGGDRVWAVRRRGLVNRR